MLWEIGADGIDVRTIRARLDLDSGYLSRILRGLESEGLVTVEPDPDDQRVRRDSPHRCRSRRARPAGS